MAKINLLPWRAERRKARQQEFITMLGVAAAAGVLISLLIVMYYVGQIEGQNNRNTYRLLESLEKNRSENRDHQKSDEDRMIDPGEISFDERIVNKVFRSIGRR